MVTHQKLSTPVVKKVTICNNNVWFFKFLQGVVDSVQIWLWGEVFSIVLWKHLSPRPIVWAARKYWKLHHYLSKWPLNRSHPPSPLLTSVTKDENWNMSPKHDSLISLLGLLGLLGLLSVSSLKPRPDTLSLGWNLVNSCCNWIMKVWIYHARLACRYRQHILAVVLPL